MKLNYLIIPLIVLAVAWLGGQLTGSGMDWYRTIKLPSFTPPGSIIGLVWTIIFILSAISAIIFWNKTTTDNRFYWIIAIFIANAILNIAWSYLFFNQHLLGLATIEAAILDLSVIALILLLWPISKISAGLLVPYAGWAAFATYLTYLVWSLNK